MAIRHLTALTIILLLGAMFVTAMDAREDTIPEGTGISSETAPAAAETPSGTRAAEDFIMFRADNRRTGNVTNIPPASNEEVWKKQIATGTYPDVYSSPAIVGDDVFVGASNGFFCFDLATGAQNWKATAYTGAYYSSPYVIGGKVYVGSLEGNLRCFDASTGSQDWAYDCGSYIDSSPLVVGSNVYVAASDGANGYLYSVTTSGSHNWHTMIGSDRITSSPAYYNGYLYIGTAYYYYTGDNMVRCLDLNGTIEWTWTNTIDSSSNGNWLMASTPAIEYGNVYVTSYSGRLICLDAAGNGDGTTDLQWHYATSGMYSSSSAAVANGNVFWGVGSGGAGGTIYSVSAYGNGGGGSTLRWSQYRSGSWGIGGSAVVSNGKVFVPHTNMKLYCFDETSGTELWAYTGQSSQYGIDGGPALSDGYAVFGCDAGYLYCIGGPVIPPVVESVSPTSGSVGVALDTTVSATFDLGMTSSALGIGTFLVKDSQDTAVSGSVSYSPTSKTATFTPFDDLAEAEVYTVTILGTVTSDKGAGLDGDGDGEAEGSPDDDYTWSFTTVELNAPALASIPTQKPTEDLAYELDVGDYISDADTPLAELIIDHNSSYVTKESGFVLTFTYTEGALWENVNISVSDGTKMTWQTVRFNVDPVNDGPELDVIPAQHGTEDEEGRFDISTYISDIDTPVDTDHFTLTEDSENVEVEGLELVYLFTEGILKETFNITLIDGGAYSTDAPQTVTDTVVIYVQPVNDGPYLRDPGPQTVTEDEELLVTFEVIDPDDDEFTFYIDDADGGDLPDELDMDDDTLTLAFTPTNDDVGTWNLTVTVEDYGKLTDEVNMTITVVNANDPPEASVIEFTVVDAWPKTKARAENLTATFTCVEVGDIDGDALTYRWDFDNADGKDDGVTGLEVVHTYPFGGTYEVTLTVDDGNGGTAVTTKTIGIHEVPVVDDTTDGGDGGEPPDGGDTGDGGDENTTKATETTDQGATLSTAALAGIIGAIVAAIVLVLVLVIFLKKKPATPPGGPGAPPAGGPEGYPPGGQAAPYGAPGAAPPADPYAASPATMAPMDTGYAGQAGTGYGAPADTGYGSPADTGFGAPPPAGPAYGGAMDTGFGGPPVGGAPQADPYGTQLPGQEPPMLPPPSNGY